RVSTRDEDQLRPSVLDQDSGDGRRQCRVGGTTFEAQNHRGGRPRLAIVYGSNRDVCRGLSGREGDGGSGGGRKGVGPVGRRATQSKVDGCGLSQVGGI